MDITTTYLGLKLSSPIIVGSSGLTDSVKKIEKLEKNGAGAVVLKSIFEEEIAFELEDILKDAEAAGVDLGQFDYYDFHLKGKKLDHYINLIKEAKKKVAIPMFSPERSTYSLRRCSAKCNRSVQGTGTRGI